MPVWIRRMGVQVMKIANSELKTSEDAKKKNKKHKNKKSKNENCDEDLRLGILCFEVACVMSKAVHLWRSLSDKEVKILRTQVVRSEAIRYFVSEYETYLLRLACAEKLEELGSIANAVARLGQRCYEPTLKGFQHVYDDLFRGKIDPFVSDLVLPDMDKMSRKVEKFISNIGSLHQELGILTELENSAKRIGFQSENGVGVQVFKHKISLQRQKVECLKDASLWNKTFDKVVWRLARMVCTVYCRICYVFGSKTMGSRLNSPFDETMKLFSVKEAENESRLQFASGPLRTDQDVCKRNSCGRDLGILAENPSPRHLLKDCLNFNINKPQILCDGRGNTFKVSSGLLHQSRVKNLYLNPLFAETVQSERPFRSCNKLVDAAPSTLGGSALALHYAHLIIFIEKLVRFPHLISQDTRDDLYRMLPFTVRKALRLRLKSHTKKLAVNILDGSLAADWKGVLERILGWLAPLAHNMLQWQTEHNFEQQQIVSRSNILLLQSLYFADQSKIEATITEILVGLNYICRYEQDARASSSISSRDDDDLLEWHCS